MEKLVIAWDLDGTLISAMHRARRKENGEFDIEYWLENSTEELIAKDILLPLVDLYKEFKKTGFTQICVTARRMNQFDFKYLKDNGLEFAKILHRKNSEELDSVLKDINLNKYFEQNSMIPFMAFDDKLENLKVFDKYGFRVFNANYMNAKLQADNIKDLKNPSYFLENKALD